VTAVEEVGVVGVVGVAAGSRIAGLWLGGRFRLDERIGAGSEPSAWQASDQRTSAGRGLSVWKATDELLSRPVTIHLLPRGLEVPRPAVEAVQAAARVNDPRLATVYDTDYSVESPYIVSEWTRGTHLEDLVLSGLPSPALAAAMIADAADAIAVAHQAGRPHLRLSPRSLRWDNSSGLKITGLGIDAALADALPEADVSDPAAADTRALARMLYALLTGYWPGDEATALPPAPRHRRGIYTPRQVRAGVPGVLDAITGYALRTQPPSAPRSVLSPAGLAMALHAVQRPSSLPFQPAEPAGCAPDAARDAISRRLARPGRTRSGTRQRTTLLHPAA
jgi:serine/threonine protein kinase